MESAMDPDAFNKETGICSGYRIDSSMDAGPAVSLLRYAKGDRGCQIMLLIFLPQPSGTNLTG
jgi:hypothetical protein